MRNANDAATPRKDNDGGAWDYDGDDESAVYRPSEGRWYVFGAITGWGIATDIPVPGNYDLDDATEIPVYRPSGGRWDVNGGAFTFSGIACDKTGAGRLHRRWGGRSAVLRPSAVDERFNRSHRQRFWRQKGRRETELRDPLSRGARRCQTMAIKSPPPSPT